MLVPAAVEELNEADVALEEAAGEEAVGGVGAGLADLGAVGVDPHSLGGVSRLGVVVHEVADLIAELLEELRILKRLKRLDHGEARILGEVLKIDRLVRDLVLG